MKVTRKSFVIIILLLVVIFAKPRKIEAKTNDGITDEFLPQAMSVYEKWSYTTGDFVSSSPAVADMDGDGNLCSWLSRKKSPDMKRKSSGLRFDTLSNRR